MSEPVTGGQHLAPIGYGESAAQYMENLAGQQARFGTLSAKAGVNALRALAAYIRGLDAFPGIQSESLLLGALYRAQQRHTPVPTFKAGREQGTMLVSIGDLNPPIPALIFEELIAIGIKDGDDTLATQKEALNQERALINKQAQVVPALEDKLASTAAELDQTRAALAATGPELDELRDEVDYWRELAKIEGIEAPSDDGESVTVETTGGTVLLTGRKRVRHPSEPNVYVRWSPKANAAEWFAYSKQAEQAYTKTASEADAIALRDRYIEDGLIPAQKTERNPEQAAESSGRTYGTVDSPEAVLAALRGS